MSTVENNENLNATEIIRSAQDLKSLLMRGDEYTENVIVDYMGQKFEVPIKPIPDLEITDIMREMKSPKMMKKVMDAKKKLGSRKDFTAEEKKALAEDLMNDSEVMESAYNNAVLMKKFCEKGIPDKELSKLVANGKWGITQIVGQKIQQVSSVPPEDIRNFFTAKTAKSS